MHIKPDFTHAVTPEKLTLAAALGAMAIVAAATFWPHQDTEDSYIPPTQDSVVANVETEQAAPSIDLN